MKLALALICKGSDDEARNLETCLEYASSHVDGIFVTITHKEGDERNKAVEKVAQKYKTHISDFEWVNSFAAARNFNFSQVTEDFTHILWLDADDGLRNGELLKPIIEENPTVDAFILQYLYAFDKQRNPTVVHYKTQVVKNDGCVTWVGRLHEDFSPNREITSFLIEGVDRIHLKTDEGFEEAKKRNLEVALKQVEDEPNDPRSSWNLGNSYKALNRDEEALAAFDTFLARTQSDDERYIVRLRRAEALWRMGQKQKALEEAQFAIGLRPDYPDAYHFAGNLYLELGRYEDSIKSYLSGLTKKAPKYTILVYNPRDYDWTPLKNLARAFYAFNRPDQSLSCLKQALKINHEDKETLDLIVIMEKEAAKYEKAIQFLAKAKDYSPEKLKDELVKLPSELRSSPNIAALEHTVFIKTESSGKDLSIMCGYTEEMWTPDTAKTKGIGGSEEAVIWVSKLLTEQGWNVTVYNNCGTEEQTFDGVTYKPYWAWNYRDKQDVTILWRTPRWAKYAINSPKVYVDMHDVIPSGEFTPDRLERITKVFVKSKFHRSLFENVPDEKFVIVPNGIDPTVFEGETTRDPLLLVNTSSPDRSLSALLDIYEQVKKEVPEAKLKWAYGWGVWDTAYATNPDMVAWKSKMQARMKELGVEELGRVSHGEVAKLYLAANVFLYPSEFAEIDCISLSKAMAAGAVPITTDFAAMGEKKTLLGTFMHSEKTKDTWSRPYQFDFALEDPKKKELTAMFAVKALKNPLSEEERQVMRQRAIENYNWNKVVEVWNTELCG